MRKQLLLVVAAGAFGVLAVAPVGAYADPGNGNGATVFQEQGCQVEAEVYTVCHNTTGEQNSTVNPSGNEIYEINMRLDESISGPNGYSTTTSGRAHVVEVVKDHNYQVLMEHSRVTTHFHNEFFTMDCVYSPDYHIVDGRTQFNRGSTVCTTTFP